MKSPRSSGKLTRFEPSLFPAMNQGQPRRLRGARHHAELLLQAIRDGFHAARHVLLLEAGRFVVERRLRQHDRRCILRHPDIADGTRAPAKKPHVSLDFLDVCGLHSVVRHYSSAECGYGMGAALSLGGPCQTADGPRFPWEPQLYYSGCFRRSWQFLCPRN